jgi:formate C-acetyltransferase
MATVELVEKMEVNQAALERVRKLKVESVQARQDVCVERARYLTESYKKNQACPMIIRRAKALRGVLENINLFIEDKKLKECFIIL